jgi:hypothetical protein
VGARQAGPEQPPGGQPVPPVPGQQQAPGRRQAPGLRQAAPFRALAFQQRLALLALVRLPDVAAAPGVPPGGTSPVAASGPAALPARALQQQAPQRRALAPGWRQGSERGPLAALRPVPAQEMVPVPVPVQAPVSVRNLDGAARAGASLPPRPAWCGHG